MIGVSIHCRPREYSGSWDDDLRLVHASFPNPRVPGTYRCFPRGSPQRVPCSPTYSRAWAEKSAFDQVRDCGLLTRWRRSRSMQSIQTRERLNDHGCTWELALTGGELAHVKRQSGMRACLGYIRMSLRSRRRWQCQAAGQRL
jgi:hypothetical protein